MDKPTEAQRTEFWKWCGFKRLPTGQKYYHFEHNEKVMNWMPPDKVQGFYSIDYLPRIDLNNLFKYAVPKLEHCLITTDSDKGYRAEASIHGTWYEYSQDPALALFWAIQEVIKDSSK